MVTKKDRICPNCEQEMYIGQIACACGWRIGLPNKPLTTEQPAEKVSADTWSAEDEAVYAPLRRKRLRIEAKARRDKTRVRKFTPRSRRFRDMSTRKWY